MNNLSAIILAAGQGTRMKSEIPKVLHEVCGRSMLSHVVDAVRSLKIKNIVVVVGYKGDCVREILGSGIRVVTQKKLLGTADAVKSAKKSVRNHNILIICADACLVRKETLSELIKQHFKSDATCTFLTASMDDPSGYGRIIRDHLDGVCGIGEDKDISDIQKNIKEVNSGIYCFKKGSLFKAIDKVKPNNTKREFYLTDVIKLLADSHAKIEAVKVQDTNEVMGINSRQDLAKANQIMRQRILNEFMSNGVTILDPVTTFISNNVVIGRDSIIHPFTVIDSNVKIGKNCSVGPFCHLRSGTVIEDDAKIGNFVEVVRSRIGKATLAKHFSYLGDAFIGSKVNIGAGTVTANFNGKQKNKTTIGDGAFIGSDTVLIAPIKVGRGATTGAGCVVIKNRNIPDKTVVAGVPAKQIK